MKRLVILLAASVALAIGPGSSAEAALGGVVLEISAAAHDAVPLAACRVSVPDGANGLAVLDAAVASGCIDGYKTVHFDDLGDDFVTCVTLDAGQELCQQGGGLATYWNLFENNVSTTYGLGGFRADPGDELELTYTSAHCWAVAC